MRAISLGPSRLPAALAAALLLTLFLTGCGEQSTTTPPPPDGHKPGAANPGTPAGKEDTLARIKREGVLKWGADAEGGAPFVFRAPQDTNKIVGFEMDIMDAFCKHLGVKSERVQGQWDSLPDNLIAGRSDMVVNGIEINDDRKEVVLFSDAYYVYEQQLTVRAEDKDKYKTLDDLKGHKISVLSGAEAQHVLERAGFTDAQIDKKDDSLTPYQELELGRVDAVLQESIIAAYYAGPNAKLYNQPKTFSPGKYGIIVRKADATLIAETNKILADMKKSGELARIYTQWKIMNDNQKTIGVMDAAAAPAAPATK